MRRVHPNFRRAVCATCAKKVGEQDGWYTGSAFGVYHDACVPLSLKPFVNEEKARATRKEITAEGFIFHPDRETRRLLSAAPGAKWLSRLGAWSVSMELHDRPEILAIARKLDLKIADELMVPSEMIVESVLLRTRGEHPETIRATTWLAQRTRGILGVRDVDVSRVVSLALPEDTRDPGGVLVVTDKPHLWQAALSARVPDVRVLPSSSAFFWPKEGQVLVCSVGKLPAHLLPQPVGKNNKGRDVSVLRLDLEEQLWLRRMLLVIDHVGPLGSPRNQAHQKVWGLAKNAGRVWVTGLPRGGSEYPRKLYGLLRATDMFHMTFGHWRTFLDVFGGTQCYGRVVWPDPRSWDVTKVSAHLDRVCLR